MVLSTQTVNGIPLSDEVLVNTGGSEVSIVLDHAWTTEEWNSLVDNGLSPLRQLNFNTVLAWDFDNRTEVGALEGGLKTEILDLSVVDEAEWNGGNHPIVGDLLLVVLEPRLPAEGVSSVIVDFETIGMSISDLELRGESSPLSANFKVIFNGIKLEQILNIPGILWVEPVLPASARNLNSASVFQTGEVGGHPGWLLGLNGQGVVIAYADSGIDRDHACFRNLSTGETGENLTETPSTSHRKIVHLNESLDDWDNLTHEDARHGTHVGGTLGCWLVDEQLAGNNGDWFNATPSIGTSASYAAKLVVQDVVNMDGWVPPDVDYLLWEASEHGAVIHSDSWGDDTTAYTARSGDFDAWAKEVPWSLAFIAPGNTGGTILEPANARNVVSVGASTNDGEHGMYSFSSAGPTEEGTRGILIAAPGTGIVSAAADGVHDSFNSDMRSSSGTSMATPSAASYAAILQQMVEQGWIRGDNETFHDVNTDDIRPRWVDLNDTMLSVNSTLSLSSGFTPSGNLLRALLTLTAESLSGASHQGTVLNAGPDSIQGWGRPELWNLLDYNSLEENLTVSNNSVVPLLNVWVVDSFRLTEGEWGDIVSSRIYDIPSMQRPLERIADTPWFGDGVRGPFLTTGDNSTWKLNLTGEDLDVRLAWNSRPHPSPVDDLQLVARFSSGKIAVGGNVINGESVLFETDIDLDNISFDNETVTGIIVKSENLSGEDWIEIVVRARAVTIGNVTESIGLDGDRIGFAISAMGVGQIEENIIIQDEISFNDTDGDGFIDVWEEKNGFDANDTTSAPNCMGSNMLCSRTYDNVTFPQTHNSFSTHEDGILYLATNHYTGLRAQWEGGIRAFMIDAHYRSFNQNSSEDVRFCHGGYSEQYQGIHPCSFGSVNAIAWLSELKQLMDGNMSEVVSFQVESYVSAEHLNYIFEQSGMVERVFVHTLGEQWPTLAEMISNETTVVVFWDMEGNEGFPWIHELWAHAWDTSYADDNPENMSCVVYRGDGNQPVWHMNNWLREPSNGLSDPARAHLVNEYDALLRRSVECWELNGKRPTFIVVDWWESGDVVNVTKIINAAEDWSLIELPSIIENMPPVMLLELLDLHLTEGGTIKNSLVKFRWNISNDGDDLVVTSASITNANLSILICSSNEYLKECDVDLVLLGIQENIPFVIQLQGDEFDEQGTLINRVNISSGELIWAQPIQEDCLDDNCLNATKSVQKSSGSTSINLAMPGLVIGSFAMLIIVAFVWWKKKDSFFEDERVLDDVPNPFISSKND